MTQPIGYYMDTNIPEIKEIEEKYGSKLQDMERESKIFLIAEISGDLESSYLWEHSEEIHDLACKLKDLSEETDKIDLLKVLVNGL